VESQMDKHTNGCKIYSLGLRIRKKILLRKKGYDVEKIEKEI
jgi:hypothetical protein